MCCWIEQCHYLGDVGDEVLAEGQAAADEPHGNHMVGQANDVLVKPATAEKPHSSVCTAQSDKQN